MFKTEPHLHVSEISPCAKIGAAEMVRLYHEAGYTTVFISDHLKQVYTDSLGDISWQDKMTVFLSGFYKAREAGKKYGMHVLMSAEVLFEEVKNHYLLYGITKAFLDACPDLCKMRVEAFCKIAKAHNVFIVQAHPFRDGSHFPTPEYVDAMEIFNSNPRHTDFSDKAAEVAKANGLYVTAGSDAHRLEDVGKAGILSEHEITSAEEYIRLIKSGKAKIYQG